VAGAQLRLVAPLANPTILRRASKQRETEPTKGGSEGGKVSEGKETPGAMGRGKTRHDGRGKGRSSDTTLTPPDMERPPPPALERWIVVLFRSRQFYWPSAFAYAFPIDFATPRASPKMSYVSVCAFSSLLRHERLLFDGPRHALPHYRYDRYHKQVRHALPHYVTECCCRRSSLVPPPT